MSVLLLRFPGEKMGLDTLTLLLDTLGCKQVLIAFFGWVLGIVCNLDMAIDLICELSSSPLNDLAESAIGGLLIGMDHGLLRDYGESPGHLTGRLEVVQAPVHVLHTMLGQINRLAVCWIKGNWSSFAHPGTLLFSRWICELLAASAWRLLKGFSCLPPGIGAFRC